MITNGMEFNMGRKPGSPRQQSIFKCKYCDFTSKKNSHFILHSKEKHDVEL